MTADEQSAESAHLPFAPLSDFELIDRSAKYIRMAGTSMMDAARYTAERETNLTSIAEESARRYAALAHELDSAYFGRYDVATRPGSEAQR